MNRAYSVLEVRALDESARKFSGVATTPSVDRVGDIIDPLGVKFTNPLVLLHQHRHDAPIGTVKFKKPTKDGIEFEAEMPKIDEPGPLQDRVNTAWGEVKHGLVRATSVGFRPIEYSFMENGGVRYSEVEVYELSIVSIPANADAVISTVKSIDQQVRKEAGIEDDPLPEIPAPQESKAATGYKALPVVKVGTTARDRAPFVIRRIHPAKK